jgi:hypothetical protein
MKSIPPEIAAKAICGISQRMVRKLEKTQIKFSDKLSGIGM